ncbi:MAG: prepilin-type N-terminal cleavage/methylation domain-containing protein [Candidatus Aminicenantales bacterium]
MNRSERPWKIGPTRSRGFTLLEMLIGLLIMSIMVMGLLSLYSKGQTQFMNENIQADILESSRYPMAWLARDVKSATQVATSWLTYTTSASTLVLQIPSVDANGLIIDVASKFDYVIYQLSSLKLQRIVDAGTGSARVDGSRYLATDVTGLVLAFYDASDATLSSNFNTAASVRATLTANHKGFQRSFQGTLNSKFKLRNK